MIGQSAGEKLAKITPRNNVYGGASEIFLNHQRFLSCPRPIKPYLKIS
jgi:hypothetical protein